MFRLFQRPKLDARFEPMRAQTDEFARQMSLAGHLTLVNEGSDAELSDVEMMVIAGFRRIPLAVPAEWRALRVASGARREGEVSWCVTLDAPLRAEAGELSVSLHDQRRRKWDWRLPFVFDRR
jgi:hypothetical protein